MAREEDSRSAAMQQAQSMQLAGQQQAFDLGQQFSTFTAVLQQAYLSSQSYSALQNQQPLTGECDVCGKITSVWRTVVEVKEECLHVCEECAAAIRPPRKVRRLFREWLDGLFGFL